MIYYRRMNEEVETFDDDSVDVGESHVSWETWEYPPHERSRAWFVLAAIAGAILLVIAITSVNYLFAIIILLMGVILLINGLRHPDRVEVHVTDQGVVVGDHYYDYKDIKDFSIIYEPPEIKLLYIDFNRLLDPMVVIPLEDVDPNDVRDSLLPYVFENLKREDETLTDMLRRMYKL